MTCGFGNPIRVLLVDSDRRDRFRLTREMLRLEVPIDCAASLQEARDAVRGACGRGSPYAAICTEAQLQDAGPEAIFAWLGHVCEQQCPGRMAPVFLVSGTLEDPIAVLQAFRAGCQGWIPKPVDPTRLECTLRRVHVLPPPIRRPRLTVLQPRMSTSSRRD